MEQLTLSKLQLAEIIEAQVRTNLDRFKEGYNKANPASFFDYRIVESDRQRDNMLIKVLEVSTSLNGTWSVLFRTAYGFDHEAQTENTGEWKLTIWKEALYHIIGGGITFGLELAKARAEGPTA